MGQWVGFPSELLFTTIVHRKFVIDVNGTGTNIVILISWGENSKKVNKL